MVLYKNSKQEKEFKRGMGAMAKTIVKGYALMMMMMMMVVLTIFVVVVQANNPSFSFFSLNHAPSLTPLLHSPPILTPHHDAKSRPNSPSKKRKPIKKQKSPQSALQHVSTSVRKSTINKR